MIVVVRLVEVIHTNCMSVISLWVVSFIVRSGLDGLVSAGTSTSRTLVIWIYSSACLSSYIGVLNYF